MLASEGASYKKWMTDIEWLNIQKYSKSKAELPNRLALEMAELEEHLNETR